jgi:hypothetical protein
MHETPPNLDYQPKSTRRRVWGISASIWLVIAGFCAFLLWAGVFAGDMRNRGIHGWRNIAFVAGFALIGVSALIMALFARWRKA